jgi:hypothetical protein
MLHKRNNAIMFQIPLFRSFLLVRLRYLMPYPMLSQCSAPSFEGQRAKRLFFNNLILICYVIKKIEVPNRFKQHAGLLLLHLQSHTNSQVQEVKSLI